jgi:predicted ABC-type ATPase
MAVVDLIKPADGEIKPDGRQATALDERLARLSARHPSSPSFPKDSPRADRPPDGPGSSELHDRIQRAADAARRPDLDARLAQCKAAGLQTHVQHSLDGGHEVWTDEREVLHNEIVDDLYAAARDVPCEHHAILAGGLPGAGKTTVLAEHAGIDRSQYLMINPDVIKSKLVERGMVPGIDGMSPMEATELAHEEASHIAKRLAQRAHTDGRNLIWDITMSTGASTRSRIDQLREAGYTRVEAVFVDIPVDVSIRRAAERHHGDQEKYLANSGYGGRYISPEEISAKADPEWGSQNRSHFEKSKDRFDAWRVYDNSIDDRSPVLVQSYPPAGEAKKETG